ncbi:NAD(P)-dependent oxidoreductase [Cnuibacter sp. UC19_7]|uniref:NAD(P)-dependent oxidoreductase n=1 Tax=Cnuibacter sp. UC19_7 TaxID=3350166 RepID=UPI00366ECD48
MRIGIAGLGRMGGPIAQALHRDEAIDLVAYDVDPAAVAALPEGLSATTDARELTGLDVLVTVLPGPVEVVAALGGEESLLKAVHRGGVWLDLTSNDPRAAAEIALLAAARGVASVAAPMRGGPAEARSATLDFVVAGDPGAVHRVTPLLRGLGAREGLVSAGDDVASAHVVKLLGNALWFVQALATTEALLVARSAGLDPDVVAALLRSGPGTSRVLQSEVHHLLAGDVMEDFAIDRVVDELRSVSALAADGGVEASVLDASLLVHDAALERYGPVLGELLGARLVEDRSGGPLAPTRPKDGTAQED